MKHFILFFFFLFICTLAKAQNKFKALATLKEQISETNKQLPIDFDYLIFQKLEIVGSNYVIHMILNEEIKDFDEYVSTMNQNKASVLAVVCGSRIEQGQLFVDSELNIKIEVNGSHSKRKQYIYMSSDDIKKAYKKDSSAKDYLMDMIVQSRKTLPEYWGNGLTLTSIEIDNNYICYRVFTDESFLTMEILRAAKDDGAVMAQEMLKEYSSTDDIILLVFIRYVKLSGMGMKYIYWSDNSPDVVTVTLTPQMLKSVNIARTYYW